MLPLKLVPGPRESTAFLGHAWRGYAAPEPCCSTSGNAFIFSPSSQLTRFGLTRTTMISVGTRDVTFELQVGEQQRVANQGAAVIPIRPSPPSPPRPPPPPVTMGGLAGGSAAAPATALLPRGLCLCQYLKWEYWGGELDTPAGAESRARVDVGNINSWIAGPLSPARGLLELQKNNVIDGSFVFRKTTGRYFTSGIFGAVRRR